MGSETDTFPGQMLYKNLALVFMFIFHYGTFQIIRDVHFCRVRFSFFSTRLTDWQE